VGYTLSLTDGTTTVTFTGNNWVTRYVPEEPKTGASDVTETVQLKLTGAAWANIAATIQSVKRLLLQAEQRNDKDHAILALAPVYLQISIDGAPAWRSEVLSGLLASGGDGLGAAMTSKVFECALIVTRRPYWEGPEATLVDGTNIENHDDADAGHDNWVDIAGASVAGSLPTPIRLELDNQAGDATGTILAGLAWRTLSTGALIREFSGAVDANCSGGGYEAIALSGSEAALDSWYISPSGYAGGYYRVLLRLRGAAPANTQVRLRLYQGGTLWQQGDLTTLSTALRLQELGTLRLPPTQGQLTSLASLQIVLRALGSGTLDIDFLALVPMDGYRKYTVVGTALPAGERLVDDGISVPPALYTSADDGTGKSPFNYVATGQPLMLQPGLDQRLHIWQLKSDGTAAITRSFRVYVYYRPRRATL
jgi:hypothetical protein